MAGALRVSATFLLLAPLRVHTLWVGLTSLIMQLGHSPQDQRKKIATKKLNFLVAIYLYKYILVLLLLVGKIELFDVGYVVSDCVGHYGV